MQLKDWGKREGWRVEWKTPDHRVVPHDASYSGDFFEAITPAFNTVANNGGDVCGDVWEDDRTEVVDKAGASQ